MRRYTGNKMYNDRLDFINDFFQKNSSENEETTVYADVGWKCNGDIYIQYHRVKNRTHTSESYWLYPKLMCDLSDSTVVAICTDLLSKWRSK